MLLSDKEVADYIDENFVASWEMVREVPKVTIDFGDGKVLKRTLAGNTVMSVCTPEGKMVDAFPGVYTPADFKRLISPSLALAKNGNYEATRKFHENVASRAVPARLSAAKGMVESPLLSRLQRLPLAGKQEDAKDIQELSTDSRKRFLYMADQMEDISKAPATAKYAARRLGIKEAATPEEKGRQAIEIDSFINANELRVAVHTWFTSLKQLPTPAEAKEDLFVRLLHIDYNDPYLGLADIALPGTPGVGGATKAKG